MVVRFFTLVLVLVLAPVQLLARNIVIFAGGSGAGAFIKGFPQRELRDLKVSVITTITDNGGSTGEIRQHLGGPALGDIRNQLNQILTLEKTGEQLQEMREVQRFLELRLDQDRKAAEVQWRAILAGTSPLLIGGKFGELVVRELHYFESLIASRDFNMSRASLGNFFLFSLFHKLGSLSAAVDEFYRIFALSHAIEVIPATDAQGTMTVGAELENNEIIYGQNNISHPSLPHSSTSFDKDTKVKLASPIREIFFFDQQLGQQRVASLPLSPKARAAVAHAEMIIYAMGSLYTSIVPSIQCSELGSLIASLSVPKILLLNGNYDRETFGLDAADFVGAIQKALGEAGKDPGRILSLLLYPLHGEINLAADKVQSLGVRTLGIADQQSAGKVTYDIAALSAKLFSPWVLGIFSEKKPGSTLGLTRSQVECLVDIGVTALAPSLNRGQSEPIASAGVLTLELLAGRRKEKGLKPRIELRNFRNGPISQVAMISNNREERERLFDEVHRKLARCSESLQVVKGGSTTVEVGIRGIDKGTVVSWFVEHLDVVLDAIGYPSRTGTDARLVKVERTRTIVFSDADETIWGFPAGNMQKAADIYLGNSPVLPPLLGYLRLGGIVVIITGNAMERTIERIKRGGVVPSSLLPQMVLVANGGQSAVYFDKNGEAQELLAYTASIEPGHRASSPTLRDSSDYLYLGDDINESGNDMPAFLLDPQHFICVPSQQALQQKVPALVANRCVAGGPLATAQIFEAIVAARLRTGSARAPLFSNEFTTKLIGGARR